jgi:hypothetical protein
VLECAMNMQHAGLVSGLDVREAVVQKGCCQTYAT